MEFPKVFDIASKDVITVHEEESIETALERMHAHNHREIIIRKEGGGYGILSANDLIRLRLNRVEFSIAIKHIKYDTILAVPHDTSVLTALKEIKQSCNCLCVEDENATLCGFVTYTDIVSSIDPKTLMEQRTISEMLLNVLIKQADVSCPAIDVIGMMDDKIHDCVVIFRAGRPEGIITTKDTIRLLSKECDLSQPIAKYMSSPLDVLSHNTTIKEALEFIQTRHFKRVIVTDDQYNLLGQITQEELIAKVYSRWAEMMRKNDDELKELNKILQARADKYREMASLDTLTGVFNRYRLENALTQEIARAERYDTEAFSVVFFDIDHFKRINDNYGHLIGDEVLKILTAKTMKLLRTTDILARWGGEEFVVVFPHTDREHALQATQKLQSMIREIVFPQVGHITCSFGVAQYYRGDSITSLLHRADEAVYRAKAEGRDRIELEILELDKGA